MVGKESGRVLTCTSIAILVDVGTDSNDDFYKMAFVSGDDVLNVFVSFLEPLPRISIDPAP